MARIDENYRDILLNILKYGHVYNDPNRAGITRKEVPFVQVDYNLKDGFPILTTKAINFKNIVTELLWFLRGNPDIKYLVDNGCNIWNKDTFNRYLSMFGGAYNTPNNLEEFKKEVKDGTICASVGKLYPHQWRNSGGVDQISRLLDLMRTKPMSSEMVVNSWIPGDLKNMALPPCHYSFQIVCKPYYEKIGFYIIWNQRSTDFFHGEPYNVASYALLAKILEKLTGLKAIGVMGNLNKVHLYDNQIISATEQSQRDCYKYPSPDLVMDLDESRDYLNMDIDTFLSTVTPNSFSLSGYNSFPALNVEMLARD